ncbi:MAG: 50S ribosomal protein L25 [Patescibacteria group bacterium]|nr:50S ribosomal protein L25 [Patescibacteria group bacterium]
MLSLNIQARATHGAKNDQLKKAGRMPAVFYGPKEASTSIAVDAKEFAKVWKQAGESSVIILRDEKGAEHEALIHETDVHPVTGEPRHADFYVIEKGKKVEVEVPLEFVGISPAIKDLGGILVKVIRALKIEAAPRDLPHKIDVDISKLVQLTDTIHVKDLSLPAGVDLKVNPDDVVASVAEIKEEAVEAPAAPDLSAIEVEAKGKEPKEGEEGAAPASDAKKSAAGDSKEAKKPSESKK